MIKLNRFLKHMIFLSILLIPIISFGIGPSQATSIQQPATISTGPSLNAPLNSKIQANIPQEFFKTNEFSNGTSINVTREVIVNTWAYATINDTVSIHSTEETFNAFTYTLPLSLYYNVDHISFYLNGKETTLDSGLGYQGVNLTTTNAVLTFIFAPNDTSYSNAVFSILLGVNNLVSNVPTSALFPFNVSGINFLPWFNFPMTKYNYAGGIQSYDTAADLENTTYYAPQATDLGLTVNVHTDYSINKFELAYSTMRQLPNFNYTQIEGSNGLYPQVTKNQKFIPAFSNQFLTNFTYPVTYRYDTTQAPIMYSKVAVTITVDPWGFVDYNEITTVTNMGVSGQFIGGKKSILPVFVNSNDVQAISVYDNYANLTKTTSQLWTSGKGYPTNVTLITIASRSNVLAGSTYTYDLQYSIPAKVFMNQTAGAFTPAFNVTLPAMSMFNWTNRQVDLTINFPALATVKMPSELWGVKVTGANMSLNALGFRGESLHLQLNNFSLLDNIFETFQVSMPAVIGPFFPALYNMFWFFMAGLLIIVVRIFTQRFSHLIEVPTTVDSQIPFDLMRDFVTAYEEKTALRSRLSDLEKKRKNLRKVEFDQRSQTLRNKQLANDKKLVGITAELSKVGPTYREAIKNLELAEAERDQILSQITDLDKKKKASRIRPEIYNKLKNEQNNRLNKAITKIERVLNELRSLLRDTA